MENSKINFAELKEAIIKVVAFFDMFDYPLTLNEIWRNLNIECELIEVIEALENADVGHPIGCPTSNSPIGRPTSPAIEGKNGFYFLAGRDSIVEERLKRYSSTNRKFKRAMLVAKIFRFIPWIKMVAIGNLLGAHNLKDDSDIDFFIVTEEKRIWLTRFFSAGLAKLLGLRPQANNSRDKICLSFYVSEKAMGLNGLMLKDVRHPNADVRRPIGRRTSFAPDIYFIYWLAGLTPIYDVGGVYDELIKANQRLYASLPNYQPLNPARQRRVEPFLWGFYHDIIDLFIGGLESQFKSLQLKLLPLELKNLMNRDSRVVISDQIIKLHANDRREEYREKYNRKINEL